MQVDNIEDEPLRRHRGGRRRAGEVAEYSFQMRFSPLLAICWIVLKHGAFREGPATERRKNLLRESERSRAYIKSIPAGEGEAGPGDERRSAPPPPGAPHLFNLI